jgi:hypothetical protein
MSGASNFSRWVAGAEFSDWLVCVIVCSRFWSCCDRLRLAFVAPAMVEAICQRQQPTELSAQTLLNRIEPAAGIVGATGRARHQVEVRVLRSGAAVPKGAQQPVDFSRVIAFIA